MPPNGAYYVICRGDYKHGAPTAFIGGLDAIFMGESCSRFIANRSIPESRIKPSGVRLNPI